VETTDVGVLEGFVNEVVSRHGESAPPNGTVWKIGSLAFGRVIGFVFGDEMPECVGIGPGVPGIFGVGPFNVLPQRDGGSVRKRCMHDRIGINVLKAIVEEIQLVLAENRVGLDKPMHA